MESAEYQFFKTRENGKEAKPWRPSSSSSSMQFNRKGNTSLNDQVASGHPFNVGLDQESIDARAASYILYVQERFRLQTAIS